MRRLVYCTSEFLGDFFKESGFRVCECAFEAFPAFMYQEGNERDCLWLTRISPNTTTDMCQNYLLL